MWPTCHLGKVAGSAARFFSKLIRGFSAVHDDHQLVDDRYKKNQHTEYEAHLWDPNRNPHESLRDFIELPALEHKRYDRPQHVAYKKRRDRQCDDFHPASCRPLDHIDPKPDTHELTMPECVAQCEERRSGGKPTGDVVGAADE